MIGDYNGDGKSDIARVSGTNSGYDGVKIYITENIEDNWNVSWKYSRIEDRGADYYYDQWGFYRGFVNGFVGDVNGDGKDDIGRVFADGVRTYVSPSSLIDLLHVVENGIGGTTTIEYEPSSKYSNHVLPFSVKTVASITVDDGNGMESVRTYDYSGGLFDFEDREFRGFENVTVTDPNGTYTKSLYLQDDIYKGVAQEQTVYDVSGNKYTQVINSYACVSPDPATNDCTSPDAGIYFPYLERQDTMIYDGDNGATPRHIINEYTFDDYGNVTSKYSAEETGSQRKDEKTEHIDYNYTYDPASWMMALPDARYVTDKDGNEVARASFTYHPDGTGNLWKKERWNNEPGGQNPVTVYTYEAGRTEPCDCLYL
jgi:hypothetical protein